MPKLWPIMVLAALLLWMGNRPENRPIDVLAMMPTPGPAKGNVLVVVGLGQPAVEVRADFAEKLAAVIDCETGGTWRADMISPTDDWGLAQLNRFTWEPLANSMGYVWEDMLRPGPNLEVAQVIWRTEGWEPWSCKGE